MVGEWSYRTQRALSVEAVFLLAVELSEDDVDVDESDLAVSDFGVAVEPLAEPLPESLPDEPESPLSDVIDDDEAPRLSVL
ncbi:MAG: hypothetical protein QOE18_340 [Chloroflexota bacterium]|nr:hypothetical protein [Chloroflexota bacterium]